jgi:hypothetical protein
MGNGALGIPDAPLIVGYGCICIVEWRSQK